MKVFLLNPLINSHSFPFRMHVLLLILFMSIPFPISFPNWKFFDAIVTPIACFGVWFRCIVNFRRMIRCVVGAPGGICWGDPPCTKICISGISACEKWWKHVTWTYGQKHRFWINGSLLATSWISFMNVGHAECYIGNLFEEDLWHVQQWIGPPNLKKTPK